MSRDQELIKIVEDYQRRGQTIQGITFCLWGLMVSCLLFALCLASQKWLLMEVNWRGVITFIVLVPVLSGAVGLLWAIARRRVIAQVDRALGLEAKLMTVCQLMDEEKTNPFYPLLIKQVLAELEREDKRNPFTIQWQPLRKYLIIALCSVMAVVLAPQRGPRVSVDIPYSSRQISDDELISELAEELFRDSLVREATRIRPQDPDFTQFQPDSDEERETLYKELDELQRRLSREQEESQEILRRRFEQPNSPGEPRESSETPDAREEGRDSMDAEGDNYQPADNDYDEEENNHSEGERRAATMDGEFDDYDFGDEPIDGYALSLDEDTEAEIQGSTAGTLDDDGLAPPTDVDITESDYEMSRARVEMGDDSYITAFLEELLPPQEGVQHPNDVVLDRLVTYRTELLNHLTTEQIPAAYRDLVREYFSLIIMD